MIKSVNTPGAVNFGLEQFKIGIANNIADRHLKGQIQDVRIYNKSLSAKEVLINYDMTRPDGQNMKVAENGTLYI